MGKVIHVVLFDQDEEYIAGLSAYVRATDYAKQFVLKLFSRDKDIQAYLNTNPQVHILIGTKESIERITENPELKKRTREYSIVYVQEEQGEVAEDSICLYKYQPLHQFFDQLHHLATATRSASHRGTGQQGATTVLSVYSPIGGSGKSATAAHIAMELAAQGKRVFYLNVEALSSTPSFFPTQGEDAFSKLLYYIKTKSDQLDSKFMNLRSYDPYSKVEFLSPSLQLQEMLEMERADVALLIHTLRKLEQYDWIVIDLEASFHERVLAALDHSDHILWIILDDLLTIHRTLQAKAAFQQLAEHKQAQPIYPYLVLNKHIGHVSNNMGEHGIIVDGYLPYIPEWKSVKDSEVIARNPAFRQGIRDILVSLMTRGGIQRD